MSEKSKKNNSASDRVLRAVRGMHDILPSDQMYWDRVYSVADNLASFYGFGRIEPPILEFADLFRKTEGEATDIVEKEMYTLKTKGGDFLALRPEYTPSISRAYLEHSMGRMSQPQKLYHFGPVFRHDNPQLGRYRQFFQVGFEILGGLNDPIYDAQVILLAHHLLRGLKIKSVNLKINSIGCRVCRPIYRRQLQAYYKNHEKDLCADCQKRLKANPLRLLDCKNQKCMELREKAPNVLDKLCSTCTEHFKTVLEYLDELQVPYTLDNQLVRGLDYYNRTVFEMYVDGPGSEVGALPAGGRYDYLIEMLGSHLTPAVGFACGVERVIAVMKAQGLKLPPKSPKKVFVAHAGELAKKKCLKLVEELREAGISVAESLARESLKAQLKVADREGTSLALIIGQKEMYEDGVIMRDLKTGTQESMPIRKVIEEIRRRSREN